MNRLIITGASGHGRVVANVARKLNYKDIVFLDDDESIKECSGYPVVGNSAVVSDGDLFIAVGNVKIRKMLMERFENRYFPVLIHPNAVVAEGVEIGSGTVVMAGAVINPGAVIGRGCIVNTSSSVDHDCKVGDYCHVAVGGHICVGQ